MLSSGPDWRRDVYFAAYRGLYERSPSQEEAAAFYYAEPWGFPSDTEYAVRLMTLHKLKWSEVIAKLKGLGL